MEQTSETSNLTVVCRLYQAISRDGGVDLGSLLACDLEWWFHGPQNCHHMMNLLTGNTLLSGFKFNPQSMDAIDDRVIVEGWEGDQGGYWVHVWTLNDGMITQFREFFNTWITVRDLRPIKCIKDSSTLWQSHNGQLQSRSFPGIMLAI